MLTVLTWAKEDSLSGVARRLQMPADDNVDRLLTCVDSVLTCVDSVDITPENSVVCVMHGFWVQS